MHRRKKMPNSGVLRWLLESVSEPRKYFMSQSWEDIANEVVPADAASGGLATGARRGPSIAALPHESSGSLWLPTPDVPRVVPCRRFPDSASLAQVLEGFPVQSTLHGSYYHMARTALDYDEVYATLPGRLQSVLERERFPELSGGALSQLLFMDIETTGLSSGTPLFLIGMLWFDVQKQAKLDLLLARNYDEEEAVLAAYHARARGKILITFNGKRFDWPFIEGRSRRFGLKFEAPKAHLDVLHLARRTWKNKVPNCRLQTLETFICGRARVDDIGSSHIPATYETWLERQSTLGRGATLLGPIVHHNALDVLTMAELLCFASEKRTWKDVLS
jgi:uncharacterized protein YprB with RNaseH-like and TPR domain